MPSDAVAWDFSRKSKIAEPAVVSTTSTAIVRTYGVRDSSCRLVTPPSASGRRGSSAGTRRISQQPQGTQAVQRGQQHQDRVGPRHGRDALRGDAAEHAAQRARGGDASVRGSRARRVEAFGDERPEPRQQEPAGAGQMEIDHDDDDAAPVVDAPFDRVADCAHREAGRDDRERRESDEEPREDRDQRQHQRCRGERQSRQSRRRPGASETRRL